MIPFVFSKYVDFKVSLKRLIILARWLQDVFEVPIVVQLTGK